MLEKSASVMIGALGGFFTYGAQVANDVPINISMVISLGTSVFLAGLSYGMLRKDVMTIAKELTEHKKTYESRVDKVDEHFTKLNETLNDVNGLFRELKGEFKARKEGLIHSRDSDVV